MGALALVYMVCMCVLQYMVVYQCIVAQASMAAFFVDGSSLDNLQVLLISQQTKIGRTRINALLVWTQLLNSRQLYCFLCCMLTHQLVPLREVVRNQAALDFTCTLPPGVASQRLSSIHYFVKSTQRNQTALLQSKSNMQTEPRCA